MDAGTASSATNWWAEAGRGAITLAVGFIGAVLLQNYRTRTAKRLLSATYLENIAGALETIADALEKNEYPTMEIHMLKHLVRGLQTDLRNLVDEETFYRLEKLSAEYYQPYEYYGHEPEGTQSWIIMARKTAGRVRAKVNLIKAQ